MKIGPNVDAHVGTFVNIPKSCKNFQVQQIPDGRMKHELVTDKIVCDKEKYRIQYRFPEGYIDGETISFGMDALDRVCAMAAGKPCDNAKFTRVPKALLQ